MKTTWTIIIVIVALIIIYFVYNKLFPKEPPKTTQTVYFHGRPYETTVVNETTPVTNAPSSERVADNQKQCDKNKITNASTILYSLAGAVSGLWDKFKDPNNPQIKAALDAYNNQMNIYNGLIDGCGTYPVAQPIVFPALINTQTSRNIDGNIDCNSLAYRQKLTLLKMNLPQLENELTIAAYNLSQRDVAENREKAESAYKKFELAKQQYSDYFARCNN